MHKARRGTFIDACQSRDEGSVFSTHQMQELPVKLSASHMPSLLSENVLTPKFTKVPIFIDREAREIMYLVASVRLPVCPSVCVHSPV